MDDAINPPVAIIVTIWRQARYGMAVGGRGLKRSSPAAIEVKIDAVAEPMFKPIVTASLRDLRGKAFLFGIHGTLPQIAAAELALVPSMKFVSDCAPLPSPNEISG